MHSALPQAMVICYANHAERINPFPTRQNDKLEFEDKKPEVGISHLRLIFGQNQFSIL